MNFGDHFTPERVARAGISRTWQEIRLFASQTLRDNVALATKKLRGENPLAVLFTPGASNAKRPRPTRAPVPCSNNSALAIAPSRRPIKSRWANRSASPSRGRFRPAGASSFSTNPWPALDANGVRDVVEFLAGLVRTGDVTLVIVEHVFNIPLIVKLASVVWTLSQGRLTVESPELAYSITPEADSGDLTKWIETWPVPAAPCATSTCPAGRRCR